jgi:anaerobic selenocysteine-containing dehydrogenase
MPPEKTPATVPGADGVHFRTCPLCEATCGLTIEVEGGRVKRIRGDADDVFSRGYVCPKGATLKDLHEDPDWLKAPLVGRGESPREVGYDEAFAEVERRLRPIIEEHGRNAVAVYLGNPNVHNIAGSIYVRPLIKALGTKNVFSASTVDQMPRHASSGLLYGGPGVIPVPDIDRTDLLLMLGANPLESNGSLCTAPDFPGRLKALRARGGKLVVIDPKRTRTAELADVHLAIRPGTDVQLLLALAHVLFEEGLVRLGRAADHIDGLDDLERAATAWTPERAAEATGIAAATIRDLARSLADANAAAVYGRLGTNTVRFGTLTSWAADVVTLLAGHLDAPGGLMWPSAAHARASDGRAGGRGFLTGRWKSRVRGLPEVMGELPVAALAEEIETPGEGQIKALVTIAGNPVLSTPNGARLAKALSKLELMVSVDPYRNETTCHADVTLPVPTPLERSHYDFAFYGLSVRNVVNYSPAVFETDQPQESEVLARLALIAQGQPADADPGALDDMLAGGAMQAAVSNEASAVAGRDASELLAATRGRPGPERVIDALLRGGVYGDRLDLAALEAAPHGIDLGALEPQLPGVLRTSSGRIELMSEPIVEELERLETESRSRTPSDYVLIGRRHLRSNNSWMHNIERLVRGRDRCTLQIHPDDAKALGLDAAGAQARVRSRVGEVVVEVEPSDALLRGVVSLPHGYGHDAVAARLRVASRHAGVNSNLLTDEEDLDRLSGTAVLNGIPVEIEAVSSR